MTDSEWTRIRTEYITTGISYRKICEKYGIPLKTLCCRAKREDWVAQRQRSRDKIAAKSVKEAEKREIDYRSYLYDLAYKVASDLGAFTKENSVSDMVALGIKPRDITGAIKDLGDILHVKSEADIAEQQARIDNLRRQAEQSDKNSEITVTIAGDLSDYAK